MTNPTEPNYRVIPRVWIGIALWIGYLLLVFVVQSLSGISYSDWGDSASNLFLGAGISLIIGSALLALTTSLLGWWRPVLHERKRCKYRWPIFIPILMAVAVLLNLAGTDWKAYSGAFLAASLTLALVGFTEEIVNRGLLLVGFRTRLSEGWVWFLTSTMFALTHFINIALGAEASGTILQVLFAFLAGTVFYILRRVTGSLWWAMLLHGLWDFSVFATGVGTAGDITGIANILEILAGIIGVACVFFVIRGTDERIPSRRDTSPNI